MASPNERSAAAAFLLVVVLQGRSFRDLGNRFVAELSRAEGPCVELSRLSCARGTKLTHWSSTSLSIVLQGRSPSCIALDASGCGELRKGGGARIAPGEVRPPGRGWFRLPG